jgi:hypothetical protein
MYFQSYLAFIIARQQYFRTNSAYFKCFLFNDLVTSPLGFCSQIHDQNDWKRMEIQLEINFYQTDFNKIKNLMKTTLIDNPQMSL